jgi:hypothetical protein
LWWRCSRRACYWWGGWLVGGVVGGLYCEGGGDCGTGVARELTTSGGDWLVGGVVGGLYCDGEGDCGGCVVRGFVVGGVAGLLEAH